MKVWDLHCDTLSELRKAEHAGRPKSFAQNDLHIDLEKLQKGQKLLSQYLLTSTMLSVRQQKMLVRLQDLM